MNNIDEWLFPVFIAGAMVLIGFIFYFAHDVAIRKLEIMDKHGCATVVVSK